MYPPNSLVSFPLPSQPPPQLHPWPFEPRLCCVSASGFSRGQWKSCELHREPHLVSNGYLSPPRHFIPIAPRPHPHSGNGLFTLQPDLHSTEVYKTVPVCTVCDPFFIFNFNFLHIPLRYNFFVSKLLFLIITTTIITKTKCF